MLSRQKRTRATAVVVVAALVGTTLLGALAVFGGGSSAVEIPAQGPWAVLVAGDLSTVAHCADDPAVVDSYMSADQPSSHGGLALASDARVADAERVVECVARGIDPARISVVRNDPTQDAA